MAINKPLLFVDFDGTLCDDKFWRSLPAEEYEKIQKLLFVDNKAVVNNWMRGKYTSEEINAFLAENLSLDYQKLWETFVSDCKTMSIPIGIIERIIRLKQSYKVILVTGNMDCFSRFTAPALNLDKYFDSIINSYDEKQLKDDDKGEQFLKIADRESTNIENCILVDDSSDTCKTFESLGGKAYPVSFENNIHSRLKEIEKNTS